MDYSGSIIRYILLLLLSIHSFIYATKLTVDAEGSKPIYPSLNELLRECNNSSSVSMPDTVLFAGTDVDSFEMNAFVNEAPATGVLFLGQNNDPDMFPVISHTGEQFYNFFQSKKITFEKVKLTGTFAFNCPANAQPLTFRKCVISGFSSASLIAFQGASSTPTLFENCLFVNNSRIFSLDIQGGGRRIEFVNCTFDSNTKIFQLGTNKVDSSVVMKNCIFSACDSIYTSAKMKSNISYSLTSESSIIGYGTTCKSGSPEYVKASGRSKPSDWKIPTKSLAAKTGTPTGAPIIDIGNRPRISGSNDAGCWIPDVPAKPNITDEPDTVIVNEDSTVSFSVVVTGVELQYAWYASGDSTTLLSDSSKVMIKAAFSDSGSKYYCIVTNDGGADTSKQAILNVLKKPQITKDLSDTTVSVNVTLLLYIKASGSNISFQWYRNQSPISAAIMDTITFKGISLSNNGDTIYCVVKNILGKSISSKSIVLKVNDNEGAKIKTQPIDFVSITMGDAFSFSTDALGSGTIQYVWYKNGLAKTDSVGSGMIFSKSSATLSDSGIYRCIVSNGYGDDTTIVVTVKVIDPSQLRCRLQLTGEFIDREHVRILIKNLKTITAIIPNPNVDTVFLWSDTADYPILSSAKKLQFKIPLSRFAKDTDTADTVLTIPKLSAYCYSNYFIPAVKWKNPDTLLVGDKSSGAVVSSCSKEKLVNPIKINCSYISLSDTVKVNLTQIPPGSAKDSIEYLIIQYGNDALGFINDTILAANLSSDGNYRRSYVNSDFLNDPQMVVFSVRLRGILGNLSDTVLENVQVGIERPANNISLSVANAYENAIDLVWTILPAESVDSIRVWHGKTVIPLKYNPDTSQYSSVVIGGDKRSHTVTDLLSSTLYYFAAQIKKNGLWSSISSSARVNTKTLAPADTQRVSNTIKINGLKFDTTSNVLIVRWTIDRTGLENMNIQSAICFSGDTFSENGPGLNDTIIDNINFNGENITNVIWDRNKSFGKTYYIWMLMRKENAKWSKSASAARSTVVIPLANWENLTFFNPGQDSIYVLNNSILVRKGKNWNSSSIPSSDMILFDTLPANAEGFIRIGNPFRFKKAEGTPDIEIGVRYGTIPDNYSARDVWLYVYKNNKWYAEPRIAVDLVAKTIFSNFPIDSAAYRKNIHLLMIDTATPKVEITYDSTPVEAGKSFYYQIFVSDNSANAVCSLKCGSINLSPVLTKVFTLNDTVFNGVLDINNNASTNSFRVFVTITDHKNTVKCDLSRQVLIDKNPKVSIEGEWVPVSTISVLDDPSIEHAFLGICNGEEWKYDSTRFRIFNWYTTGDGGKADYIQYSPGKPDIFNVVPGKVFWLKVKNGGSFDLGPGKTVSIKEPFRISLPADQWTDLCIPYNIGISLADIFSASNIAGEAQDSVWIFEFYKDPSQPMRFNTVYYPVLGTNQSINEIKLKYTPGNAYTIYNAIGKNVELIIPPIDTSYSLGNGSLQKKAQENGWFIKINSIVEDEITAPVYCVFKRNGHGLKKLPLPPHPGHIQVGLLDSVNNTTYGTFVFNGFEMGYSVPLYFSNSSRTESKTVTYSVTASKSDYTANCAFYNPENGNLEPVSTSDLSLTLGPREHAYRWALVGDSSYFKVWMNNFVNVQFGLIKVSAIARNILGIQYTVPYSGVNAVKVMVINQLGQCVWSTLNRNLVPGRINCTSWNINASKKLAAGAYIIQVSAYNAGNRQVQRIQSRYLHIR